MLGEIGPSRIRHFLRRLMSRDGEPCARFELRHLLRGVGNIVDRLAREDRESRNERLVENLHLIVADQHGDIGFHLVEDAGQPIDRRAAGCRPLAPFCECYLGGERLRGAQLDEFFERVGAALEAMMAVLPVRRDARVPLLRRRRQHRPMRCAEAQDDPCHAAASLRARNAAVFRVKRSGAGVNAPPPL